MNYTEQLLKEHSRKNTDAIANCISDNPAEFKKIIQIIFSEKTPLPQRASWLLTAVNKNHPELLEPYLKKFIDSILSFKVDAVKRNMVGVLSAHKIRKSLQGKLLNVCFELIASPDEPVAVKTLALQCAANLTASHPGLKAELKAVIDCQLPKTSAAFHARARMIFKKLK